MWLYQTAYIQLYISRSPRKSNAGEARLIMAQLITGFYSEYKTTTTLGITSIALDWIESISSHRQSFSWIALLNDMKYMRFSAWNVFNTVLYAQTITNCGKQNVLTKSPLLSYLIINCLIDPSNRLDNNCRCYNVLCLFGYFCCSMVSSSWKNKIHVCHVSDQK